MWSRVGVHGGTSGRSDRLEQERQCVHNPSRNAHGRLYRQFLTVALSLSLLGFCTLDPASIGSFGSGCMWAGRRRLRTAVVKLHRDALPPVFQLLLRGGVGRDASRSNGGGSRPSGTSLDLLLMPGRGLLTAGFQAGWLLELGLRGLRQRLCRCRACRFFL